jgi:hypothetical protein
MLLLSGDISCSSCSVTTAISTVLVRQKEFLLLMRIKKGCRRNSGCVGVPWTKGANIGNPSVTK